MGLGCGAPPFQIKSGVATAHARLASGWLASLYREGVNPLDRYERFPTCYMSFPVPGFILTLPAHDPEAGVRRPQRYLGAFAPASY
jgi:hypothetical protein